MAKKESRKTRAQRAEERRERRVRMWMGIFIIALMVLSSFAFVLVFYAPDNTESVTGLNYRVQDNRLLVTLDGREIPFYSYPDEGIYVPPEAVSLMQEADVLITAFDPYDTPNLPYIELVRWDIDNYVPVQHAVSVLNASEIYPNYPVGGCEQATPETPVLRIDNRSVGISVNESCITLSGQQATLLGLRDQLLYAYYEVR